MKLGMRNGRPTETETPERATGRLPGAAFLRTQLQAKDSQQPDTLKSDTTTSPCTYAIEPPCTERYARWCERSGLLCPSYSMYEDSISSFLLYIPLMNQKSFVSLLQGPFEKYLP